MSTQLSFDFDATDAPVTRAAPKRRSSKSLASYEAQYTEAGADHWAKKNAEARDYWRVGAVTSLPLMCDIEGIGSRYAYMLPGVVEAIAGDAAAVRIYASPEYGSFGASGWEDYPLHLALAVKVPLRDLGKYGLNTGLLRVVADGRLSTGDAALAAEVWARLNAAHEH